MSADYDNENPPTQGEQSGAQSQETPNPEAASQFAGIEKRINELTAKYRGAEETVAQKDQQIAELVRNMSELALRSSNTVSHEPPIEIDPEERRKYEAVLSPQMRRMEAMIGNLESQMATREISSVAATYGDARIEVRAQELMNTWKRGGYTGWQPKDAVRYAAGELYEADRLKAGHGASEQNRFNQLGNSLLTSQSAPPNTQPSNGVLPHDFDSLPVEKQISLLENRLKDKAF